MESEKLLDPSEPATDMDNHIIECYQLQDRFLIGKNVITRVFLVKARKSVVQKPKK